MSGNKVRKIPVCYICLKAMGLYHPGQRRETKGKWNLNNYFRNIILSYLFDAHLSTILIQVLQRNKNNIFRGQRFILSNELRQQ